MKVALFYLIIIQARKAKFFTILADETTDSSIKEQLSLCVCYIHKEKIVEGESLQSTDNVLIGAMAQISQGSLGRQSVCLVYHDDKKHRTQPP
uniref:DUF4371 domain-containing protein n=1 Tax=Romanomermis culicivorax TaxID=13658 RepID=A0A915IX48_ROMCU